MKTIKEVFDDEFRKDFPATYEAALKGKAQEHMSYANAWWGFSRGHNYARGATICATCYACGGFLAGVALTSVLFWFGK